ncbi:methyl-accepting chemotaxis protein [Rhodoferax sp.]|uniref:methyl-accepting chemotaxis protein n=1 Tax=Rhodoferax sp. TaxID=50421 RepID=UPI00283CD362|nr:methyl-accepting chemotaxis protein [Rhodoferax sp.]MDR3371541.1 methyl-accepting chemotaxis protein [Rhodoferax sp.]
MKKFTAVFVSASFWHAGASLMRALRFSRKMGVITIAFMIPIVWLLSIFIHDKLGDIAVTRLERSGVRYASAIYPAIDLAGRWRQQSRNTAFGEGGGQLQQARQDFDAIYAKLQALDTELGSLMAADHGFAAVRGAVETARSAQPEAGTKADPEAIYNGMIGVSRTLSDLLDLVTDGSGLALDPELASYYLMSANFVEAPDLLQNTVEVRGLVRTALKGGQITADNMARLQGYLALMDQEMASMQKALDKVQQVAPAYRDRLSRGALQSTKELVAQVRSSVPPGTTDVKDDSVAFVAAANSTLDGQFNQVQKNLQVLDAMLAEREATLQRSFWLALSVTLASLLLAAYFLMGCLNSMAQGFRNLRQHLIGISMGDLRTPVKLEGKDEITGMLKELGYMQQALALTVEQVKAAAETVVLSSMEIAHGTQDLAGRTESAAAALEESSAALEQTNSTVAMTAESVGKASQIATDNASTASQGGTVMQDVANTMGRIQVSSQRISDIIGVIDGIAFQTNILALNAAVEAARAGEQGRGFAVVATEVRALAGRSATAAKEIKTLITSSTEEVTKGSEIVHLAGDHMHQIVDNATSIKQLLDEVANGAREQSLGIGQIGQAVHELDRNTQANAALVEETAAAANALQGSAVRMAAQVDEFQLPGAKASALLEGIDVDGIIDGHRQWKVKLRQAIENGDKVDVATLSRDDCCGLGKWIYGDGQRLSGRASFTALIDKHAQFHQVAGQVGQLINERRYEQAEDALAPNTPFTKATSEVVLVLSAAKRLGFV